MSMGMPYDSDAGRALGGADHRADDRRRAMRPRPRWRASSAPSPAMPRTARRCCGSSATIAAPRMARRGGLRGAVDPAGAARRRELPRPGAGRRGARSLGRGAGARREARLPQRPGDGDRADRHDRPGDGLRHDRHRARFRAGQVQEARRRRLFQDHQPRGAAGADARSATAPPRSRRSSAMRWATARSKARPASTTRASRRRASTTDALAAVEAALASAFDIKFAFNKWTLGEAFCIERPGDRAGRARRSRLRPAGGARLRPGRDRRGQHLLLRRDDLGGRAAPQARASGGVRLRQPVRPQRQALHCRSTATSG